MTKRQFTIWLCLYILIAIALLFIWLTIYNASGTEQTGATTVSVCDDALWKHVYNRNRLQVQHDFACVTVTGIKQDATHGKLKDGCRREADGDLHCWLKVDNDMPRQSARGYTNEKNRTDQDGNLVFEPMCQYAPKQADTIKQGVCKDWTQQLVDAPVGSHVAITGAWVLDAQHGHLEIHPVTKIEVLK